MRELNVKAVVKGLANASVKAVAKNENAKFDLRHFKRKQTMQIFFSKLILFKH